MQNAKELEQGIAAFAGEANAALIVTASPFGANHPDVVAGLAARYKLPAIYRFRYFIQAGGLMSYSSVCQPVSTRGRLRCQSDSQG